jgi:hypothetical protein
MNDRADWRRWDPNAFSLGPHIAAGVICGLLACAILPALMIADFQMTHRLDEEGAPFLLPLLIMSGNFPAGMGALVGLGTLGFVFLSVMLDHVRRQRPFAIWLPAILIFPAVWLVCLLESLKQDAPVAGWLATGTLIAVGFCAHWFLVQAIAKRGN